MFSALIKAFTGRAGVLSSLLALLLIALTSAAVLLSLPRIEQSLENSGQAALSEMLAPGDNLVSFRAEGRNFLLEGKFEDEAGLSAKLKEIEGVRSVIINGLDAGAEMAGQSNQEQPAVVTAVVAKDSVEPDAGAEASADTTMAVDNTEPDAGVAVSGDDAVSAEAEEVVTALAEEGSQVDEEISTASASGEPLAQHAPEPDVSTEQAAEDKGFDQSFLSLRYDGTKLSLSGHLADEQMAQLIADRVANVVPARSVLEINVDGNGKGSPLNWMREFLETVSGLPDDAQGRIEGSDREGVIIIPDAEQNLSARGDAAAASPPSENQFDADVSANRRAESSEEGALPDTGPEIAQSENTVDTDAQPEQAPAPDAQLTAPDAEAPEVVEASVGGAPEAIQPTDYITGLNLRISEQALFESGDYAISDILAAELDGLAAMMQENPGLFLRVVGNLDFSVDRDYAEYVGIDRAREVKKYLYLQGTEPFRIFATPLPRDRAYDQRVQLVFYISE